MLGSTPKDGAAQSSSLRTSDRCGRRLSSRWRGLSILQQRNRSLCSFRRNQVVRTALRRTHSMSQNRVGPISCRSLGEVLSSCGRTFYCAQPRSLCKPTEDTYRRHLVQCQIAAELVGNTEHTSDLEMKDFLLGAATSDCSLQTLVLFLMEHLSLEYESLTT